MKSPFKLAFREEENFVNCYFNSLDTDEDRILIASISVKALDNTPGLMEDYKEMMKKVITQALKDTVGATPDNWSEHKATNKTGNA